MDWLDKLIEKWNQFREKAKPVLQKTGSFFVTLGTSTSTIISYMYKLRAIILAAPVAAAAAILAARNMDRLPTVVQITKISFNAGAEDALFGFLSVGVDYITRDVAVFGPLALTVACLLLTLCSKRTMYPWLISLFSLSLPLLFLLTNVYTL